MSAPALLRPIWQLSDADIDAELDALRRAADHDVAQRDPVTLAKHLQPDIYRLRRSLRMMGLAFRDVEAGRCKRLMIFTPPQIGKSLTTGVWLPFWWLIRHPTHRVVVAAYGKDLALKRGKDTRDLIAEYGHRFDLALARGSSAAADWSLRTGGGMRSVGIESGLTGHSAHLLVIDDPHKDREEAASRAKREAVWDWWSSTARTRLQPDSPVVIIMTRWHPDDLAGRLLGTFGDEAAGGMWRVLRMPAIADRADDPLGRAVGEPLPHPQILTRDTARLAAHWDSLRVELGPRDWGAMCQADPQPPEGALLSWQELTDFRAFATAAVTTHEVDAIAVDPAGGGRDLVGIIAGFRGDDGRLYLTHDASGVMGADVWTRRVCELAVETDCDKIIVEVNFGGDMATMLIRTAWELLKREFDEQHPGERNPYRHDEKGHPRLPPSVIAVRAKKNKLLRADPVAAQWRLGRIRTGALLGGLEAEWASWQPTDPDSPGRIDASVYLAYALLEVPGAESVIATAAGVSRSAVASMAPRIPRGPVGVPRGVPGRPGGYRSR